MKLILVIIIICSVIFYEKIISFFQYVKWKKEMENIHNYDEIKIESTLKNIADKCFEYSGEDIPYGRTKWFINSDEKLRETVVVEELEMFGYSPVRSKIELEFREYGLGITTEGFFHSCQIKDRNDSKKYNVVSTYLSFEGLWKVKFDSKNKTLKFFYPYGKIIKIQVSDNLETAKRIEENIKELLSSGYTNDLTNGYVKKEINRKYNNYEEEFKGIDATAVNVGILGYINTNIEQHFHDELLNGVVNNPQGHGYAAEYANDLVDKALHPLQKVQRIGQDNAKNGADRIVGNVKIQTKYLSSARNSVNAAFEAKADGGMYKYQGMQLEVPKDQYSQAIDLMKEKIKQGKVPGHTNPDDAYKIIRKGHITWAESKLIAQGGNITSIKYDALDGVIQTLPVAGISFVIVFAQAKWSGAETKDAAIVAAKAGVKTLIVGTTIYAGSQQMAKVFTKKIAEETGKKIAAESVAKGSGMVISFGIIMVPNVFNTLTGRISKEQLLKNTLVAGGGFLAGVGASAGAGAALGTIVPGAGNVAGAVVGAAAGVVGGLAGTVGSKKLLDHFIEDDRVEMFAQLKEEFIDVVMSMSITDDEFTKVQEIIFNKSLESKLKDMFKHIKREGSRLYARENIVEAAIIVVIKERPIVTEQDILEGLIQLND